MAATEESIYNRLASAPQYHPSNASLFADWNMQAGDVVQIKSDDSVYDVPIYNLKLKWNGASKIDVESTGNPEREPLPALKRREYSSNSSSYAAQKSYGGGLGSALEKIANINGIMYAAGLQVDPVSGVLLYASEHGSDYALGSSFKVQSDAITSEVTRATNAEGEMSSRITQTADAITSEVSRATEAEGSLSSQITQTADQIALKVSKGDVATQLAVEVGNVTISGGNLVVDGYITSQGLITTLGNFSSDIYSSGNITGRNVIGTTSLAAPSLTLNGESLSSHSLSFLGNLYMIASDNSINLAHYHAITATENNGVITITQGAAQDTAGSASFNIADTQFYKDAVASATAAGKAAMGVLIDQANQSVVVAESATKSALIASTVNLVYNTNNHKYTATTAATANGTTLHTNAAVSGTEAYDAGEGVGYTAGYSDGVNDGYLTGWNAAVAAITRNGNSIIGPATSDGSSYTTETKYTANYTPSTYVAETHRYTPSTYVAESHSYTPSSYTRETTVYNTATVLVSGSSHSHSNAWIRQDSGSRIYNDTTLNLSGDHSVQFDSGSDSYTKETTSTIGYYRIASGSSYTASTHSYTASVYDAETHSYTPSSYTGSSFSWS